MNLTSALAAAFHCLAVNLDPSVHEDDTVEALVQGLNDAVAGIEHAAEAMDKATDSALRVEQLALDRAARSKARVQQYRPSGQGCSCSECSKSRVTSKWDAAAKTATEQALRAISREGTILEQYRQAEKRKGVTLEAKVEAMRRRSKAASEATTLRQALEQWSIDFDQYW